MGVIWQKVWFDLWNNKMRTLLAIISIAVGVFAVGTIFGMNDQMLTAMDASHKKDMPQHFSMGLTVPIDRDTALALRRSAGCGRRRADEPGRRAVSFSKRGELASGGRADAR